MDFKLRNERIKLGITQERMANLIGVTRTTISLWENERVQPSPLNLHRITTILKLQETPYARAR